MLQLQDSPLNEIVPSRFRVNFTGTSLIPIALYALLSVISVNTSAEEKSQKVESQTQPVGSGVEVAGSADDNSSVLNALRQQIEEISIKLYETRVQDTERFKTLEESMDRVSDQLMKSSKKPAALANHQAGGGSNVDAERKEGSQIPVESAEYQPELAEGSMTGASFDTSSYAAPLEAMLAAVLVFLAPLGFSFLEASRTEQSKIPPILLRNLLVTAIMLLTFATVGSWISYGQSLLLSINPTSSGLAPNGSTNDTFWLFHLEMTIMVGLVANTILSDRISLRGHALMALILGALIHPLMGRWIWMGHWIPTQPGWLQNLGFLDFAGATVIHSMGAWFALAWLWRFPLSSEHLRDETSGNPVHALLAVFILWLNWFGLAMGYHHLDIQLLALPIINVSLAGGMAIVVSFLLSVNRCQIQNTGSSLIYFRLATGILGGLVAVSAGVDRFTPIEAMAVGGLASLVQIHTYRFLQVTLLKQDHTAAALIATHGISGVFGTLCLGFMGSAGSFNIPEIQQLGIQSLGIAVALGFGSLAGLVSALPYKWVSDLSGSRVSSQESAGDSAPRTQTLAEEIRHPVPAEPAADKDSPAQEEPAPPVESADEKP